MATFLVNGQSHEADVPPDMPLLWVLRDVLSLTGTKFGCGAGHCWGCTVLLDGQPRPSCQIRVDKVQGAAITTIEGIPFGHPVKQAWRELQVPQCGYCQPGQILRAVALLRDNPDPSAPEIAKAMRRNLCRCGTYQRIKAAVLQAGAAIRAGADSTIPAMPQKAEAILQVETFDLNPFVRLGVDGTVTVLSKHLETGQGSYTGLATLVAEELGASFDQMRVEGAPADERLYANLLFGIQGTGGSTCIVNSYEQYRQAGADARARLAAGAAAAWGVPVGEIVVADGTIRHESSGCRAGFGELAAQAAVAPQPTGAPLKDPKTFSLIGRVSERVDIPAKVDGAATFALDARLPGMLTAVVARPPRFGGKLASFDPTPALAVAGVTDVVEIPRGVAVVAENTWAALGGRQALTIEWDESAAEKRGSEELLAHYQTLVENPGLPARSVGDAGTALDLAEKTIEAVYEFPYLAHAPLEPLNCLVRLTDDACEILSGDQFQTVDQANAAAVAGLDKRKVSITTLFSGGSFGRRANPESDYIAEAVSVAKAIGGRAPVHLVWSREDDLRGGRYRPMYVHRLWAGLSGDGKLTAWDQRVAGQSLLVGSPFEEAMVKDGVDVTSVEGAADMTYAIPNLAVSLHTTQVGVPVLWWRSVGHSHSAFAVESFMDEAALAAGRDPVEFRRELLAGDPRRLAVLDLVADKSSWGTPLPAGRGRGLAVHRSFDTYVGQVAEVTLAKDGSFTVDRVTCAVDCGVVVNPEIVRAQMEGGIAYGLSAALGEAVTLEAGRVAASNFDKYPVLRFEAMPRVEVHIVASTEHPTGVGEPGVPPIAPAVANALVAAGGPRVRRLPFLAAWD